MRPSEVLIAARARIDTPDKWCQRVYVRGDRRCAIGALQAAGGGAEAIGYLYDAVESMSGRRSVADFNDSRGHADVMNLYGRAIALAQRDEQGVGK